MMAFFLLLWLLNTTSPEQKRGIADYFAPASVSQTTSGSGGILGGTVVGQEGAQAGGQVTIIQKITPPEQPQKTEEADEADAKGGSTEAEGKAPQSQITSDDALERALQMREEKLFEQAEIALRQAMQDLPDVAELSKHILIDQTPEGLRIQLVDQDGRSMFAAGGADPNERARVLLQHVARIVDRLPNRITISGHTDSAVFERPDGYSNWDLSAERANASRRVLQDAGVKSDRIYQVTGKAGSDPLYPDDPYAAANRRIAIVLLREQPPLPPSHRP